MSKGCVIRGKIYSINIPEAVINGEDIDLVVFSITNRKGIIQTEGLHRSI